MSRGDWWNKSPDQPVIGVQASAIVDASVAHTITAPADAPATADALRDDLVANTIVSEVAALDALGVKINSILAALRAHDIIIT